MEIVVVTKNRNIGIDEDVTGLEVFDYFPALPNFHNCIGLISKRSMKMLKKNRQKEIESNILGNINIRSKNFFLHQRDGFLLYDINNIKPVLSIPAKITIINI